MTDENIIPIQMKLYSKGEEFLALTALVWDRLEGSERLQLFRFSVFESLSANITRRFPESQLVFHYYPLWNFISTMIKSKF